MGGYAILGIGIGEPRITEAHIGCWRREGEPVDSNNSSRSTVMPKMGESGEGVVS